MPEYDEYRMSPQSIRISWPLLPSHVVRQNHRRSKSIVHRIDRQADGITSPANRSFLRWKKSSGWAGFNMIPFSVLDLAPIIEGGSVRLALDSSRDLAQNAERLGFHRDW